MKSLATPGVADEIVARLKRVKATSPRHWGTLTPHEMLCHLSDSYRSILGDRHPFEGSPPLLTRTVVKWIALHTPLKWPKGINTRAEVDPRRQGTRPDTFESDREALIALIRRFAAPDAVYGRHPMFGSLTRSEWLVWGYRHPDHHLRQFGV